MSVFGSKISMGAYVTGPLARMRQRMKMRPLRGLAPAASLRRHHVLWSPSYLVGRSRRIFGCLAAPGAIRQPQLRSVAFAKHPQRVLWENSELATTTKSGRPPMAARRPGILVSARGQTQGLTAALRAEAGPGGCGPLELFIGPLGQRLLERERRPHHPGGAGGLCQAPAAQLPDQGRGLPRVHGALGLALAPARDLPGTLGEVLVLQPGLGEDNGFALACVRLRGRLQQARRDVDVAGAQEVGEGIDEGGACGLGRRCGGWRCLRGPRGGGWLPAACSLPAAERACCPFWSVHWCRSIS